MFDFVDVLDLPWHTTVASSGVLGIVLHLTIRPYEIDYLAWELTFLYLGSLSALILGYGTLGNFTVLEALGRTVAVGTAFNVGALASMLVYRAFFHRLRHIPGPFTARLSKFYHMKIAADSLQNYLNVERLHKQYGDFVRTGPREVSINRESAIGAIYGHPVVCKRGPWSSQTGTDPLKVNLTAVRDVEIHKRRKRAWERGFSFRALSVYESRVRSKVDQLLSRIGTGRPVNMAEYSVFFAFDVMGDIGFSKDFHMLDKSSEHPAIRGLHDCMNAIGIIGAMPWLLAMLSKIPGATGGYVAFQDWCSAELQAKREAVALEKASGSNRDPRDVISWLIKASDEYDQSAPPSQLAFEDDARVLVITGSDTTSGVLTNALYYLTKHHQYYRKLQQLMAAQFPGGDQEWAYSRAKEVAFLDHIIYETLRLKPAVPVGLQRLQIDEVFIPGDTIASVPTHTIHRDPRYFQDAQDFVPGRWEKLSPDKGAYIPFTRGQFSCVGKNLAMMELRTVLSRIALRYSLSFAPGFDVDGFDKNAKETFTLLVPRLDLVFTPK